MKKSVVLIAVLSVAIAVCALFAACSHEHSLQHFEAKAPTCVVEGNIEYWYCADCDKYFSDETANTEITKDKTILAATGEHSWSVWTAGEGESCETGGTRSHSCTICGLTETETFAAGSHQLKYIAEVPSTCKKAGTMAHWHCDICGKNFADENASQLLSDLSLPLGSHNIVDGKCTVCGFTQSVAGTPGLEYTLNEDGTGYTATGLGTATETDIVIASEYNGLPVTAVGVEFGADSNITSVYIPGSVKAIFVGAFLYCYNLQRVVMEEGVETIGDYAFYGEDTGVLSEIILPDTLTTIGSMAFISTSLSEIRIPKNVTKIGEGAFIGNDPQSIVVDEGNTAYHSSGNCLIETATKKLILGCGNSIIPNDGSVTSIGDWAFCYCSSLTSITIPEEVTSIGEIPFDECDSLIIYCEASSKPSGWTSGWAGSYPVVWDCNNNDVADDGNIYYISGDNIKYALKDGQATIVRQLRKALNGEIVLPENVTYNGSTYSVTNIANRAFYNCDSLTSIVIPDGVTSIGESVFFGCDSLTSIVIPDGVTSIGDNAFYNCSSLSSIAIPEGVTNIGSSAFYNCTSLTSITIGGDITSIGDNAFYNCSSLSSIAIPEGVTNIGSSAFYNCTSLTSITIGGGTTSISDGAFYNCSSLTSIVIPDGVTSIGGASFAMCSSLTSITIPDSVTSIRSIGSFIGAFFNCTSLTSINFQGTMAQWKAIDKDRNWNGKTGSYTITCTDGTLDKNGNEIQ